ncbi:MAG: hypothetical protein QXD62_02065 [Candidatus Woesearchaeota archaeon]
MTYSLFFVFSDELPYKYRIYSKQIIKEFKETETLKDEKKLYYIYNIFPYEDKKGKYYFIHIPSSRIAKQMNDLVHKKISSKLKESKEEKKGIDLIIESVYETIRDNFSTDSFSDVLKTISHTLRIYDTLKIRDNSKKKDEKVNYVIPLEQVVRLMSPKQNKFLSFDYLDLVLAYIFLRKFTDSKSSISFPGYCSINFSDDRRETFVYTLTEPMMDYRIYFDENNELKLRRTILSNKEKS